VHGAGEGARHLGLFGDRLEDVLTLGDLLRVGQYRPLDAAE
jgi:hypothetical protein